MLTWATTFLPCLVGPGTPGTFGSASRRSCRKAFAQPVDDRGERDRCAGALLGADTEAVVVAGRAGDALVAAAERAVRALRIAREDRVVARIAHHQRWNRHARTVQLDRRVRRRARPGAEPRPRRGDAGEAELHVVGEVGS